MQQMSRGGKISAIPFPYEPYPAQRDLMSELYKTIESSRVGFFESPTGTGKSLSVLCAALHWQREEMCRILENAEEVLLKDKQKKSNDTSSSSDDWLSSWQSTYDSTNTNDNTNTKKAVEKYNCMVRRIVKLKGKKPTDDCDDEKLSVFPFGKKQRLKKPFIQTQVALKQITITNTRDDDAAFVDEFSLPHYDSDTELLHSKVKDTIDKRDYKALFSDNDDDSDCSDTEDPNGLEVLKMPQILYCSRTHSQISQFVGEIRKTIYDDVRCITLGSRKTLCINSDIKKLKNDSQMSEKCLDMQKSKTKIIATKTNDINERQSNTGGSASVNIGDITPMKSVSKKQKIGEKTGSCPFKNKLNESKCADFALSKVCDIEDVVSLGKEAKACPYYATRKAIQSAQMVCMPYNILLHPELRNSMGLKLKNRIVIFDESHNLVEAINHTHSAELNLAHIDSAIAAVKCYLSRFQYLLSGKNVYYVNLLHVVLNSLISYLKKTKFEKARNSTQQQVQPNLESIDKISKNVSKVLSTNDFIFDAKLDNINLFKLRRHITETHLVNRMGGFAESQLKQAQLKAGDNSLSTMISSSCDNCPANKAKSVLVGNNGIEYTDGNEVSSTNALRSILALLLCLTTADKDGRVVISSSEEDRGGKKIDVMSIRFVLLNPSIHFRDIADQARSVILLGGTMKPFSYLTSFLFPHLEPSQINTFSCGHVIDPRNIKPLVITSGFTGKTLDFTFSKRLLKETTTELLHTLRSTFTLVPYGVVVFFTSYSYMESLIQRWRDSNEISHLQKVKPLFFEPRSASDSEKVWNLYSTHATTSQSGATLFCVIGGKLSEGINFSDNLARCVVVVGLPYPDKRDSVLQEKLNFAENKERGAGDRLYEAMCMKAVNQSIGRSIRHVNDFASILLLDRRYANERVMEQLPKWISDGVSVSTNFNETQRELINFYGFHKKRLDSS